MAPAVADWRRDGDGPGGWAGRRCDRDRAGRRGRRPISSWPTRWPTRTPSLFAGELDEFDDRHHDSEAETGPLKLDRRSLLIGNAVIAFAVIGFASLAVALVVGVRPTAAQEPVVGHQNAAPGKFMPLLPTQQQAPVPPPPPEAPNAGIPGRHHSGSGPGARCRPGAGGPVTPGAPGAPGVPGFVPNPNPGVPIPMPIIVPFPGWRPYPPPYVPPWTPPTRPTTPRPRHADNARRRPRPPRTRRPRLRRPLPTHRLRQRRPSLRRRPRIRRSRRRQPLRRPPSSRRLSRRPRSRRQPSCRRRLRQPSRPRRLRPSRRRRTTRRR